ncbi:Retrovirus-related Pol polyprotein from transposon [Zancudomyces culisetae]|uniref:Retrovirus-related Pol polyprotein from transposon n=1 Tax=Zancudomyces culisetae TaxID=1213189 RepID=A0A1R1PJ62_ZANCU|nr:Retrovirus-related Pol polyprotein from transposon [Zancudomyces culisetae]|eukprot:OMH80892.1 Retrovirus-related Pol polyprotein from transposon [Zancudomyces culisetae]
MKAPLLTHPNWNVPFIITTDASKVGLGAILSQISDEGEKPIEFISRATNKHEQNYSISHLEGLAVVWAVTKFKYYIWGTRFVIRTDHKSLLQLFDSSEITGRVARWAMLLRNFDYDLEHVPGKLNPADILSRNPVNETDTNEPLEIYSMELSWYEIIKNYIQTAEYPLNADSEIRSKIRNSSRQCIVKNGKLFKKVNQQYKEILNEFNTDKVIKEIHDECHEGIRSTLRRVTEKYCGRSYSKLSRK